jgi:predicted nuclease of restriction endonuclease-like (RecB) superfamily
MAKRTTPAKLLKPASSPGETATILPAGYASLLTDIKSRVRAAQLRAAVSVNRELILLYWDIGKTIAKSQEARGYGKKVVEQLAEDLHKAFPSMQGFSPRNIWRMRTFYLEWSQGARERGDSSKGLEPKILPQLVAELQKEKLPQAVAEIPWGHNVWLLEKLSSPLLRLWYAQKAVQHGWSRSVLTHQIETELHKREGGAITNFQHTLPPPQSDLAEQTLKDPYNFDFLTLRNDAQERDLELGLLEHVQKFLLELGVGFAFVGRQHHLEISSQDYYLDLLFYHLRLRCYVVIDLKMKAFEPEFAGKMNFYLSAVDDQLRHPDDKPSIGLLLCKERDRLTVEYALRDLQKPIGVAQWQTKLVESLPRDLKGSLPTVAEIEAELKDRKSK